MASDQNASPWPAAFSCTSPRAAGLPFIFRLRNHPQIDAQAEIFGDVRLPGGIEQSEESQLACARELWCGFEKNAPRRPANSRGFKLQHKWTDPHVRNLGAFLETVAAYDIQHMILRRRAKVISLKSRG